MARIYKHCPSIKQRGAREAWKYFMQKHGEQPKTLWHMANCFRSDFSIDGAAWGMWIADYGDWRDYYDPRTKQEPQSRNLFEFIGKQNLLTKIVERLGGKNG